MYEGEKWSNTLFPDDRETAGWLRHVSCAVIACIWNKRLPLLLLTNAGNISITGFPRDNGVRILTNNSTRNNGPLMAKKTLVFFPNIPNQITRSPTLTFTAAAAA
ncbi:hypothetical protein V6N13_077164 [Hibiscus sabdariffa]